MTGKNITDILEFILHKASRYELELVDEALKKRLEKESSLGQLDVNYMARTMAEGIEKQMGLGKGQVHEMSRRLVEDMIRREKPDISRSDLNDLLDQWVPGTGLKSEPKPGVPREMLLAMITQFVSYSTGEMKEQEKRQFPEGWHTKYWNAFPSAMQKHIRDYVSGSIGKNDFWKRIREAFVDIK